MLILTHIRGEISKNDGKTTKKMEKIGKIGFTLAIIQNKAGEFLHIDNMSGKNRINFKCKTVKHHQKHAKPYQYPPPTPHDDHHDEHSPPLTYLSQGKSTPILQTFGELRPLNTLFFGGVEFYAFFFG